MAPDGREHLLLSANLGYTNGIIIIIRCVFSARLKVLSDWSGNHTAGDRRFYVAGPLTATLRCPVAVRARGTSRLPVAADRRC